MDFEVGEVVQLKSGGPKMTICEVNSVDGRDGCAWFVDCVWFGEKAAELKKGSFPLKTLERATTGVGIKLLPGDEAL